MTMRSYAGVVASALALVACGGNAKDTATHDGVITDGGSRRGTGSGGSSGHGGASAGGARSTAGGGTTGSAGARTGGNAGSGGTRTGAAGRDGSVDQLECTVKDDHATIAVEPLDRADGGREIDGGDQRRDAIFEGVVREVDVTSFVLDTCPPNADCAASSVRVTIAAPDLTLIGTGLDSGSLARVHLVGYCLFECTATILVTSLKTWGGLVNQRLPVAGEMYVAADEGGGVLPEAPYKWDTVRLPCRTSFEGGCGGTDEPAGVYALRFDGNVVVPMGEFGYLPFGGGSLVVRNLRSYVSGACDDYWNYAHWATSAQFGD